jgi:copper chaperone CopZ
MTTNLKIEGMSCSHCARAAREALEAVPGVREARVDLATGSAVVDSNGHTSIAQLLKAVKEEGYEARLA